MAEDLFLKTEEEKSGKKFKKTENIKFISVFNIEKRIFI